MVDKSEVDTKVSEEVLVDALSDITIRTPLRRTAHQPPRHTNGRLAL